MTCRCAECEAEVVWPDGEVRERDCEGLRFDLVCDDCAEADDHRLSDFGGGA